MDVSTENILAVELGLNDYDPDQGALYEVQINYTRPDQTQETYYKIGRIGSSVSDRVMQRTGTAATGAMSRYKAVFGRDGGVFVRDLEQNRSFTAYTYTNLWQAILVQLGLASGRNANTAMMSMALTENTGPNVFELGFDQGDFQQAQPGTCIGKLKTRANVRTEPYDNSEVKATYSAGVVLMDFRLRLRMM